jgi:hypothetical protein
VFLIAGHDTTSTTLTYALWALGHHPELQDRVANEVGELGDRPLTVDDLPALPFTAQVIHEALRLCPPAAALARLATRDTVMDGFRVERGTNLIVGIYALHRDPALWDSRRPSTRTDSAPSGHEAETAGNSCRSVQALARASVTTSPSWKPRSASRASYDAAG